MSNLYTYKLVYACEHFLTKSFYIFTSCVSVKIRSQFAKAIYKGNEIYELYIFRNINRVEPPNQDNFFVNKIVI